MIVICHCSPPLPLFLAISTIIDGPNYHNYRDHDFTGAAAEEVLWSNAWVHEAMNLQIQWTELEAMVLWMKMSSGGDRMISNGGRRAADENGGQTRQNMD